MSWDCQVNVWDIDFEVAGVEVEDGEEATQDCPGEAPSMEWSGIYLVGGDGKAFGPDLNEALCDALIEDIEEKVWELVHESDRDCDPEPREEEDR